MASTNDTEMSTAHFCICVAFVVMDEMLNQPCSTLHSHMAHPVGTIDVFLVPRSSSDAAGPSSASDNNYKSRSCTPPRKVSICEAELVPRLLNSSPEDSADGGVPTS